MRTPSPTHNRIVLPRQLRTVARELPNPRRGVLIVGEPCELRAELCRALTEARVPARIAESADQALEEALACGPAAIFLDLDMRDMEGVAAARLLDTDPRTAHIRRLLFCAAGQRHTMAWGRRLGISECLCSPFSVYKLRACFAMRTRIRGEV